MFKVTVTPEATKQFKHLPITEQTKIRKKLISLENNPFSGKKLSGELSQLRKSFDNLYSIFDYWYLYFI